MYSRCKPFSSLSTDADLESGRLYIYFPLPRTPTSVKKKSESAHGLDLFINAFHYFAVRVLTVHDLLCCNCYRVYRAIEHSRHGYHIEQICDMFSQIIKKNSILSESTHFNTFC